MQGVTKEDILTVEGAHGIIWKREKSCGDADNKRVCNQHCSCCRERMLMWMLIMLLLLHLIKSQMKYSSFAAVWLLEKPNEESLTI